MKILQIFGAVIAIHVVAFILIFASPGCNTGPRSIPTPDATIPSGASSSGSAYTQNDITPQPVQIPTYTSPSSGGARTEPIRPGSPNAAAVTPPKQTPRVAPVSTYSVQRGDSLWSIAKKHNLSVAELAKANSLATGVTLQPGQKLIVPGRTTTESEPKDLATASTPKSAPTTTTSPPPRPTGETIKHVVQNGESLGGIARRYGVRVGELALANNITDPAKIRAGQELVIPGGSAAMKSSTVRRETSQPKQQPSQPTVQAQPQPEEPAAEPTVRSAPRFEIAPPPPGQDLDSGLKDAPITVPTIKADDPKENPPPKG